MIIKILMPIIYGGVLAYLMLPIYNFTYSLVCKKTVRLFKDPEDQEPYREDGCHSGKPAPSYIYCCLRSVLDDYSSDTGQYPGISRQPYRLYQ